MGWSVGFLSWLEFTASVRVPSVSRRQSSTRSNPLPTVVILPEPHHHSSEGPASRCPPGPFRRHEGKWKTWGLSQTDVGSCLHWPHLRSEHRPLCSQIPTPAGGFASYCGSSSAPTLGPLPIFCVLFLPLFSFSFSYSSFFVFSPFFPQPYLSHFPLFSLFKKIFIYFLERRGGREKERERNTDVRENLNQLPLVRSPTGDQTRNLGMCPDLLL